MYKVVFKDVSLRYQISNVNLTSEYERNYVTAACNLNFELSEGDRVGVIGRNGGGKSTLLSLTAGNVLPESGSVLVKGEKLALINRGSGLEPRATLKENASLKAYTYKLHGEQLDEFVQSVLSDSALVDRANSPLNTLSKGMRGRFNIALSSQIVKPITILDEWIGTLNISSNQGNDMLNRLTQEAKIVILASHNEILIRQLANRLLLLEQGHIFYDGTDFDKGFQMLSSIMDIDPKGKMSAKKILSVLEQQERERLEQAERERLEQAENERLEKAENERLEKAENERLEKAENERLEKEKNDARAKVAEAKSAIIESKNQSLEAKIVIKTNKEPLHFINIGRTFLPSIREALDGCEISKYQPIFYPINKKLENIPKGEKICLIYRDPILRFVSGFYSRKLQGAPNFNVPWSQQEEMVYKHFDSPSHLLEAFVDKDSLSFALALAAVRETEYLDKSLCWYFQGCENILSRNDDIVLVANCELMPKLISELELLLDCAIDSSVVNQEEKIVLRDSETLSDKATAIFHQNFGYEYELFGFLESMARQKTLLEENV